MSDTSTPFNCSPREHRVCLAAALKAADRICKNSGVRLTPLRRRVLELVWSNHRPVGAYELLEQLRQEGNAAPPTVYRTLDFLQAQGLVHRLASLNAFIGCSHPDRPHRAQFLICRNCRNLAELADAALTAAVAAAAFKADFLVEQQTVELLGLCDSCRREMQS